MEPTLELVRLVWNDAEDYKASAWASQEEANEFTKQTCLIISVCWIVKRSRFYLTIASDFDTASKNYGTLRKIPKKMVVSIEPLQLLPIPQTELVPSP